MSGLKWSVAGLVLLVAASACADTIVLKDGTIIEGKVVRRDGSALVVEVAVGRLKATQKIKSSDVARVEAGKTENDMVLDEVARRRKTLRENDAEGWYSFGEWLAKRGGLSRDARDAFTKVLQIDPGHEMARKALGFVKDDAGKWRPEEEVMAERGLVRFERRWTTPAERERILEERRAASEARMAAMREQMLREAGPRLEYRAPTRYEYNDTLLRRMGYYGAGYYYGGQPVLEGVQLGGAFYGRVGIRPRYYVELPRTGSYTYGPTSPGLVVQGGDTSFTFGSGYGPSGNWGWNWGLNFSGSRGNTSWQGSIGGGGN